PRGWSARREIGDADRYRLERKIRLYGTAGVGCPSREHKRVLQMTVLVAAQQTETTDTLPSRQARLAYRGGQVGSTAGVAPGFVQGNLAILPEKYASAFHRFCQLNPKPCPIIGMSDVGRPPIP